MATIAVLGTFDTKGHEHAFIADIIRRRGHVPLMIDVGTGGLPEISADVSAEGVAQAGGVHLLDIIARQDRGECVAAMSAAAPILLEQLQKEGKIQGVISLGGGGGTAIASAAMRALPVGFPKLIVSTLASGDTSRYLGTKDITLMPSVVDIAGLNQISRTIFARAAGAICGMVEETHAFAVDRPLIVASMFGNTTKCVLTAKEILEEAGYEVIVFAATGTGGKTMESLIESSLVMGVLEITTTELADEFVGGTLTAGPDRMNAVARAGIPSVVAPGCLDMVNFGAPETVPDRFRDRTFYQHNAQVTLMRTTPEECRVIGKDLAGKVNRYTAPTTVLIPRRAISVISAPGQPFYNADADQALFEAITSTLRKDIPAVMHDCEINDVEFARACASALLENIRTWKSQ